LQALVLRSPQVVIDLYTRRRVFSLDDHERSFFLADVAGSRRFVSATILLGSSARLRRSKRT
jgi:hypothetical protein